MTGLTRRGFALGGIALALAPSPARASAHWIEVTGAALIHSTADLDAARRRALADALLSAAFAGGAMVQGHSVLSLSRMTSDLLIVRPVGRVLGFQMLSQQQSGNLWQVRIRAQVGAAAPEQCPDRRAIWLTVYPPEIRVSPQAPAWAEALARQIGAEMIRQASQHRAVAQAQLAATAPGPDPSRDTTDWHRLTRGAGRLPEGGHGLHMHLAIAPEGGVLRLRLGLRLIGPAGEQMVQEHLAHIRLPGPSPLGRAAPLAQHSRDRLAHDLGHGAVPALTALLREAGCQPVRAVIAHDGTGLSVQAGRVHGLSRGALAFTIDRDHSTEMLEITQLADRTARLAPLDPTRPLASFAGRPVRFMDVSAGLG
jgi:hypothetical protein